MKTYEFWFKILICGKVHQFRRSWLRAESDEEAALKAHKRAYDWCKLMHYSMQYIERVFEIDDPMYKEVKNG